MPFPSGSDDGAEQDAPGNWPRPLCWVVRFDSEPSDYSRPVPELLRSFCRQRLENLKTLK